MICEKQLTTTTPLYVGDINDATFRPCSKAAGISKATDEHVTLDEAATARDPWTRQTSSSKGSSKKSLTFRRRSRRPAADRVVTVIIINHAYCHEQNIQRRTDDAVDPGLHLTALPPRADVVDPRCNRRPVTLDQAPTASYPGRVGSGAVGTNAEDTDRPTATSPVTCPPVSAKSVTVFL